MSQPEKASGSWSRWSGFAAGAAALLTAIGSLIGGLAAAGVIGGGDGDPDVQQSTGTTPTTTATLPFDANPEERSLLERIPLVLRNSCDRTKEVEPSGAVASVICQPAHLDGGYLSYSLFPTTAPLTRYMNGRLTLGDKSAACGKAPSGASTYTDANQETVGSIVCYLDEDKDAWIEWSNEPARIYAYAYRPDSAWKALFNFWTGAGPKSDSAVRR